MSRDLSGVAFPPPGVYASPLTTIQSQAQQNALIDDVYEILNSPWPEQYGGTGQTDGSPNLAEIQALIDSVAAVPIGSLHVNTGGTLPDGYIWANGGSYSRSTYSALWGWVQGSGNLASSQGAKTVGQYGPGNGSSTFTVPNLTEYFVRGSGGDRETGSIQADDIKQHRHTGTAQSAGAHTHTIPARNFDVSSGNDTNRVSRASTGSSPVTFNNMNSAGAHTHTLSINNTGGSETRPKNIAYPYMIKV